ncbi:MAG: hypothetical protein ACRDGG_07425 [Anaerolineae bacterium]
MSLSDSEWRVLLSAWRRAETNFYAGLASEPELYKQAITLVRALADDLSSIQTTEALVEAYAAADDAWVDNIAEGLDLPQGDFLDWELAKDAAFNLRYNEVQLVEEDADSTRRLAEAHAQGLTWATLLDRQVRLGGQRYVKHLEMHLPDGVALYYYALLDPERGRLYRLEVLQLDPETAKRVRDRGPLEPPREFARRGDLLAEVERLREKYSIQEKEGP